MAAEFCYDCGHSAERHEGGVCSGVSEFCGCRHSFQSEDPEASHVHCLGADKLCTCHCGKGMRPEFSRLRDERGRCCQACSNANIEAEDFSYEDCICWATEFSGYSVCGVPCPLHSKAKPNV